MSDNPQRLFPATYKSSTGKSFGEMHNLVVGALFETHKMGNFSSVSDLYLASRPLLEQLIGAENVPASLDAITPLINYLREHRIASPFGHYFDSRGIVELYRKAGLPDYDALLVNDLLNRLDTVNFRDKNNVSKALADFCKDYGIAANDGTFIGLLVDVFNNSYEYWREYSLQNSDKALDDGTSILGDAMVCGLYWFMFGGVWGFIAGAVWSYVFVVSEPGDGGGGVDDYGYYGGASWNW